MKSALVTGATGFVGRWVAKELVEHGTRVIAVARENAEGLPFLEGLQVRIVPCDMHGYSQLPQLLEGENIDTVYHLAWSGVSNPQARDEAAQMRNIQATLDLVEAAHKMGVGTFIGAGSLHEAEGAWEVSLGKPITNPGFLYKAAKTCAHWMAKAKAGQLGIRFLWPVITNAYGNGGSSGRLINTIIRQILAGKSPSLSEGNQWYDFVHISDAARAFRLLEESGVDGTNYLIGSGTPRKLKHWLRIVGDIVNEERDGEPVPLGFGQHQGFVAQLPREAFSIANLQRDTGFVPLVQFEEGIQQTNVQLEFLD